jgi:O-antigen/teichoic acid export membrane protein
LDKFIKKLIGFSLGPVIGAMISFITVPVTTFFISPVEFGKASMFTVMQSLIVGLVYLGIDQSYTREYHYEKNKLKLFQNVLLMPLLLSILLSVLIFIFKEKVSIILFDSQNYQKICVFFGILIIFSIIERFILLSIRMAENATEFSLFSILIKLSILLFIIILISLGTRNFLTIVYSTIFGQIIGDVFLIIRHKKLFFFSKHLIDRKLIKRMLEFGLPLVIAAALSNFLNASDRIFLRALSSYHELGIYTAAQKIAAILQIIQLAFTSFWIPTAYRWNKESRNMKHFEFVSDALLLGMTFLFFGILLFKKYIIQMLDADYSDAQYVAGLLALVPILYTLSETTTLGIVFSGKSYYNIAISVLAIIPNIILNILLIPHFGTIGASSATAIAYIVFCLSRTYFSNKSGFQIPFRVQTITIVLFFVAAVLNSMPFNFVLPITVTLFFISIVIQIGTIKKAIEIKNAPDNWNFN